MNVNISDVQFALNLPSLLSQPSSLYRVTTVFMLFIGNFEGNVMDSDICTKKKKV